MKFWQAVIKVRTETNNTSTSSFEYYSTEVFDNRKQAYRHGEKIAVHFDVDQKKYFVDTKLLITDE
jgi:hypothetical protein